MCQIWEGDCGLWVFIENNLKKYMLNSTSNPAHFHPILAGLAVLFSRQLLNYSHDCFHVSALFFDHLMKKPQTPIALVFLTHNISAIGGVYYIMFRVCLIIYYLG